MVAGTGFKGIEELVKDLADKVGALATGSIEVKDIEKMCEDSRELYERLVVLRHRGREVFLAGATTIELEKPKQAEEPEQTQVDSPVELNMSDAPTPSLPVDEPVQPAPVPEMTLDFSPEPPSDQAQTSLIDAIAETEETKESVGEKLENAPIDDLTKAIGLNQKFMFISQIFKGNKDAFVSAVDKLNGLADLEQAKSYAQELTAHLVDGEEAVQARDQFVDLIERKFQ